MVCGRRGGGRAGEEEGGGGIIWPTAKVGDVTGRGECVDATASTRGAEVGQVVHAVEGVNEQDVDLRGACLGWVQHAEKVRHLLRHGEADDVQKRPGAGDWQACDAFQEPTELGDAGLQRRSANKQPSATL